jgi:hypothetical protein
MIPALFRAVKGGSAGTPPTRKVEMGDALHLTLMADFRSLAAERGVNEFNAIPFYNHHGGKVFSVYVPAIQLHNDSRIILMSAIEQLLNRQAGFFDLFRKSVEQELQGESSGGTLSEITKSLYGGMKSEDIRETLHIRKRFPIFISALSGYFLGFIPIKSRSEETGNSVTRTPVAS